MTIHLTKSGGAARHDLRVVVCASVRALCSSARAHACVSCGAVSFRLGSLILTKSLSPARPRCPARMRMRGVEEAAGSGQEMREGGALNVTAIMTVPLGPRVAQ
eukprot:scaffold12216_cov112-Isochrysis_galbana.AAC.6